MKTYQQARFDKYISIVEIIKQSKPYRFGSIARRLDMSELELSSFISGSAGIPSLVDLIEIERELMRD